MFVGYGKLVSVDSPDFRCFFEIEDHLP